MATNRPARTTSTVLGVGQTTRRLWCSMTARNLLFWKNRRACGAYFTMTMMINEANWSVVKIGLEGRVLKQQLFWPRNEHLLCETAMGIHFRMMTSLGAY